jgi:Ser/Thr protein kinase RdoA (MazF antagonist)
MPLSELAGFATSLDGERRSPIADAVAAAWGLPPGVARFRRSSATHVFAVADFAYLRFVPHTYRTRAQVEAVAELARRLAERGYPVAAPIPSKRSRLVETLQTVRGSVHATLVAAAPGRSIDTAALTTAQVYAWGAALAGFHAAATALDLDLPGQFDALDDAERVLAGDPPLAEAVVRVRGALAGLPREPNAFGAVHGDFEPDNLAWTDSDGFPTAYDLDEASRSWFAADVAGTLRELAGHPEEADRVATFVAGYRSIRNLTAADLALTSLFNAAHAATWLLRLPGMLDRPPARDDPSWLPVLRAKLTEHARRQRSIVMATAAWKRPEA